MPVFHRCSTEAEVVSGLTKTFLLLLATLWSSTAEFLKSDTLWTLMSVGPMLL